MRLFVSVLLVGLTSLASASTITYTDFMDMDPDIYLNSSNDLYSYTHDITDEEGYDAAYEIIDYSVTLNLYDDATKDMWEWVYISQPGWKGDAIVEVDFGDIDLGMSYKGLLQLSDTGTLDIDIFRITGDFYLGDSTLSVNVATAAVPEPSTLLLMGTGLLGLGFSRWKKKKA